MYTLIFPVIICFFIFIRNYYNWFFAIITTIIKQFRPKKRSFILTRYSRYLELICDENKKIFIPLRPEQIFTAMQCEVKIVYETHEEILHQDTDIPIFVTANDLGAEYIKIFNTFNGTEKIYRDDELVKYME